MKKYHDIPKLSPSMNSAKVRYLIPILLAGSAGTSHGEIMCLEGSLFDVKAYVNQKPSSKYQLRYSVDSSSFAIPCLDLDDKENTKNYLDGFEPVDGNALSPISVKKDNRVQYDLWAVSGKMILDWNSIRSKLELYPDANKFLLNSKEIQNQSNPYFWPALVCGIVVAAEIMFIAIDYFPILMVGSGGHKEKASNLYLFGASTIGLYFLAEFGGRWNLKRSSRILRNDLDAINTYNKIYSENK